MLQTTTQMDSPYCNIFSTSDGGVDLALGTGDKVRSGLIESTHEANAASGSICGSD
jgi:hypothetical protein